MSNPIEVGNTVIVTKGNLALGLRKFMRLQVSAVTPLGAAYSHQVKVVFTTPAGVSKALYARHINRLSDPTFNLNNGDPFKRITVMRTLA